MEANQNIHKLCVYCRTYPTASVSFREIPDADFIDASKREALLYWTVCRQHASVGKNIGGMQIQISRWDWLGMSKVEVLLHDLTELIKFVFGTQHALKGQ